MKLHKTTVFRMALRFAVLFAVISAISLGSVYYLTFQEIEKNTDRELARELDEMSIVYQRSGLASLVTLVEQRVEYGEHLRHYYAVINPDGRILAGNRFFQTLWPLSALSNRTVAIEESAPTQREDEPESRLRIATRSFQGGFQLAVAQTQKSVEELREHTFSAVLSAVGVTIVLSIVTGIAMGRVVLSRIARIDDGLSAAIASDFKKSLPLEKHDDEFRALTEKLNVMLGRIDMLLTGMRQVTDHVAHDLRSPLTRLRSRLEVTLLQSRNVAEYQEVMTQAVEDCNQLLKIFNALLSIAQAEAGIKRDSWEPVDIGIVCDELAELYFAVAEEKDIQLHWQKPSPMPIMIFGNRQLLAQAISNLLENAIRYTPARGNITLQVETTSDGPLIRVADNGPGIPPEHYQRALERFQRLDAARSTPGSGLGLSLVHAVAKLHKARLVLSDNKPGLVVEMRF